MKWITTKDYLLMVDEYAPTTDKEPVHRVSNEHGNFRFKIISHLPLNGAPKLEGVDVLPPLEDSIIRYSEFEAETEGQAYTIKLFGELDDFIDVTSGFKAGMKRKVELIKAASQDRKYSEEDIENFILYTTSYLSVTEEVLTYDSMKTLWGKYLTHKLPVGFEPEMENIGAKGKRYYCSSLANWQPKTITLPDKTKQWVGKYKF